MSEQITNSVGVDFDRRAINRGDGSTRDASQWVRQALNEQNNKIEKVSTDIEQLAALVAQAIPDNDPKSHADAHARLDEWEKQREQEEKIRKQKEEEHRQFVTKIKQDIIQNALRAGLVLLCSLLLLGSQTKVKEWVISVVTTEQTAHKGEK